MSNRFKDDADDDAPKKKAPAKPVPRRSAIKTAGLAAGGVFLATAGGIGYRVNQTGAHKSFTAGPGFQPREAWEAQIAAPAPKPAPVEGEPAPPAAPEEKKALTGNPHGLIAAGVLASSAHNTQPWRFVVRDKTIDVIADTKRNIGTMDPNRREMTISAGCCIENMVLGASAVGIQPLLNILPEGQLGPTLARLTLYTGVGAPTKEAQALSKRHTNRGPYLPDRAIDLRTMDTLEGCVSSSMTRLLWLKAGDVSGKRFAQGTLKATSDIVGDAEMSRDSAAWFRFGPGEHREGLTLPCVGLTPLKARLALLLPKGLQEDPHRAWVNMTRDVHLATAAMYGMIVVPALDNRAALIETGRLWQRLHVQATLLGLSMQPLNQLMEMADRDQYMQRPSEAERTLASLATLGTDQIAFAFRMGYSRYITFPSPRRGVEEVLGI